MKCWFIRNLMPLFIEKKIPEKIQKHIQQCLCCQKEYQSYVRAKKALGSLKNDDFPSVENYWEKLENKIENYKDSKTVPWRWQLATRMALAAAVFVVSFTLVYNFDFLGQQKNANSNLLAVPFNRETFKKNQLKKEITKTTNSGLQNQEKIIAPQYYYHPLEKVVPCVIQDASF